MNKLLWSIDLKRWNYGETHDYLIEGWYIATDGKPVTMKILVGDHIDIDYEIIRKERPDVLKALPDINVSELPGFTLKLKELLAIKDSNENIVVILQHNGAEVKVFEKSLQSICNSYYKDSIHCTIDSATIIDNRIAIRGWVYDRYNGENISVTDGNGNELSCKLKKTYRKDVTKQYHLEDANKICGFELILYKEDLSTNNLKICVINKYTEKVVDIDVKKIEDEYKGIRKYIRVLGPKKFKENSNYLKAFGLKHLRYKVITEMHQGITEYDVFRGDHMLSKAELAKQEKADFKITPKFSVVIPLFNTPLDFLQIILDSILNQTYGNLQLCLADGSTKDEVGEFISKHYNKESRITYKKLDKNGGISENTNAALELADGDYIMLSDHDDVVEPNALYEMVRAINESPDIDVMYTDEDKVDMKGKMYYDPFFKPDFNLDLLRSNNYICHIFVAKKSLVDQIGRFRSEFDGAQDYDFILRCCEQAKHIHHIPSILYHWRNHPDSTAGNPASKMYAYEAGRSAIEAHYKRLGLDVDVTMTEYWGRYRSRFKVKGNPLVSIIIPNKDHIVDLKKCIDSIYEKSTYRFFEILVVENNSKDPETFAFYDRLQRTYDNLKVLEWKSEFNFSAINNYGVTQAEGEYLLLLNNDTEVITENWIEEMLGYCQREDVGAVGAKLYYGNDTLQHGGVVVGLGPAGTAGHILHQYPREHFSYAGKVESTQDLSAVTAACLMTKREIYNKVGGLDENFRVALNDVDYCLKVRGLGKLIIYNAFTELYHYESISRGSDVENQKNRKRYEEECKRFRAKWKNILEKGDPYYNVNLTLRKADCTYR